MCISGIRYAQYIDSYAEELALSINGKKRKINWKDFTQAMSLCGVPEKVQETMRTQFLRLQPIWEETIHNSFLSAEQQDCYLMMINERLSRLSS